MRDTMIVDTESKSKNNSETRALGSEILHSTQSSIPRNTKTGGITTIDRSVQDVNGLDDGNASSYHHDVNSLYGLCAWHLHVTDLDHGMDYVHPAPRCDTPGCLFLDITATAAENVSRISHLLKNRIREAVMPESDLSSENRSTRHS
ncbi:hypothetical protein BSLG_002503 [Batrachochytrium salamandrivorans]|nr:hypothetical protein BSLG_002503 [Batrachochytrium salamandrivorans]